MVVKYDVGEKVLVEGTIKSIQVDANGLVYVVDLASKPHRLSEKEVYSICNEADKNVEDTL